MRLNFQGALAGLGHGLSTLGQQGIEEQQRVAADQRLTQRSMALEALRHTQHEQEADTAVTRTRAEYIANTPLVAARAGLTADAEAPSRIRVQGAATEASAAAQAARDAREHSFQLMRDELQHRYHMTESEATAATAEAYGNSHVDRAVIARNGEMSFYDRTGRRVAHSQAGAFEPPAPTHGPDDSSGGQTPNPYLPAPPMIHRGTTPAPTTGRDGRPVLTAPAAAAAHHPPAANTYTDDDVQATMQSNRMTRQQAITAIEARGYRRAQ